MFKFIAQRLRNPGRTNSRVGRVAEEDLGRRIQVFSAIDGQARKPGTLVDFFFDEGGHLGSAEVLVIERDDGSQLWLTPIGDNWHRINGVLYGETGKIDIDGVLSFALFWGV